MTRSQDTKADVTSTLAQIRKHYTRVRTTLRNQRLGLYQGRNSSFTQGNRLFHEQEALKLIYHLIDDDHKALAGMLISEHNLAIRISENNDQFGHPHSRPELDGRIRNLRRDIRAQITNPRDER